MLFLNKNGYKLRRRGVGKILRWSSLAYGPGRCRVKPSQLCMQTADQSARLASEVGLQRTYLYTTLLTRHNWECIAGA